MGRRKYHNGSKSVLDVDHLNKKMRLSVSQARGFPPRPLVPNLADDKKSTRQAFRLSYHLVQLSEYYVYGLAFA